MKPQSIYQKVQLMNNSINGALSNPQVLAMLRNYGYGREVLNEGIELANRANEMIALHAREYGEKYTSTDDISQMFAECYSRYMVILKLVRIAFKNETGVLYSLRATGKRNRTYNGWLNDARLLYGNLLLNEQYVEKMGMFAITRERLEEEYEKVYVFERAYVKKFKETGEAQQTTKDRDAVIDELANWYSDFRAVARIALYEKPQLLETLAINIKS